MATSIRKGQLVHLPEGLARVRDIVRECAYGDPRMELSATVYFDLASGGEVSKTREQFGDIKVVQPVYGKQGETIGYTVPGETVMIASQEEASRLLSKL